MNELRTSVYLEKVREVLEKGNLSKHITKIESLVNEEYTSLEIAAALLKMSLKEAKTKQAGKEAEKGMGGPKAGFDRLFITIGKKDRVHPKDLIDLLSQNADIPASKVGDIDLYDKFSFVEVPTEYTADILQKVGRIEVDGRTVIVEKSQKKDGEAGGGKEDFGFSDRGGDRGGRRFGGGGDRDRGGFGDRDRGPRRDGGGSGYGGGGSRFGGRGDRDSFRGGDRRSSGGDRGGFRKKRF